MKVKFGLWTFHKNFAKRRKILTFGCPSDYLTKHNKTFLYAFCGIIAYSKVNAFFIKDTQVYVASI